MQPIHQKALADITWADLEGLVAGTAAEGPNLEYKRTLADPNRPAPRPIDTRTSALPVSVIERLADARPLAA